MTIDRSPPSPIPRPHQRPAAGNGYAIKGVLQRVLLSLHRLARQSGLLATGPGRALFELGYDFYKARLEAGEIAGLRRYVEPGTAVVDIGANIGFFTTRFARWVRDGGRVFAVEPEEQNFRRLTARLARTGLADRVEAVHAAAAEQAGEVWLSINPDHPGDHRLSDCGVPVPAVTVDGLMEASGWPQVSLIKIDVQGAEARVIAGAWRTLDRFAPAVWMEVDPHSMACMNTDAEALLAMMAKAGYQPHRLDATGAGRSLSGAEVSAAVAMGGYADFLFLRTLRGD